MLKGLREVSRYLSEASAVLAITSATILGASDSKAPGVALGGAAVVLLFVAVWWDRRRRRAGAARRTSVARSLFDASDVRHVLESLVEGMGVLHPWRVTLYRVDGLEWQRLERRSSFPLYEDSGGRSRIPVDTGCLGLALKVGSPDELPWLPDPRQDYSGYVDVQVSRRLAHGDVDALRMRSRSYVAGTFRLAAGAHQGDVVGIVVESEVPNGVSRAEFIRSFSPELVTILYGMVIARGLAREVLAAPESGVDLRH